MRSWRLVLAVALLALAGCTAPPDPAPVTLPTERVVVSTPVSISIPAINVAADLEPLGLNSDGTLEVPPVTEPEAVGWYSLGVRPGAVGPSVIAAHVSGRLPGAISSIPGAFAHLTDLAPGDRIEVGRSDGSTVAFEVTRVETYLKTQFDTDAVYGDVATAQIRLVTCTGDFMPDLHSYDSNRVVFGEMLTP